MKYLNLEGLAHFVSIIKSKLAGSVASNAAAIAAVEAKIPAQASAQNQLADKDFVNSSIATNTANYIGNFDSVDDLNAYTGTKTNNDYAFVVTAGDDGTVSYDRYKYNAGDDQWIFEYKLNNTGFTAEQMAAVNSGITKGMLPAGASDTNKLSLLKHPFVGRYKSLADLQAEQNVEVGSMAIVFQIPDDEEIYAAPSAHWYIRVRHAKGIEYWTPLGTEIGSQSNEILASIHNKEVTGYGLVALESSPNPTKPQAIGVAASPIAVKAVYNIATAAQTAATEAKNQMLGAALDSSNPITDTNPPRIAAGRIQAHTVYGADAGGPATYGNLVNIGGSGGAQVFLEWSGGQSAAGQAVNQGIWYRSMRDNQSAWTAWTKIATLGTDGSLTLTGSLDVAKPALFRQSAYFGSTSDMVIGHGSVPDAFADGFANRLVEGAYMANGDDETGGIVAGGDGIDAWAPPDNDLMRFWNEDYGEPVAAISGSGAYLGTAESSAFAQIREFSSWVYFDNFVTKVKQAITTPSNIDIDNVKMDDTDYFPASENIKGISSGAFKGLLGADFKCFVRGDIPGISGYGQFMVETSLVRSENDGDIYGTQVAWAVTTASGRHSFKRCHNGEDGWSAWSSNDL